MNASRSRVQPTGPSRLARTLLAPVAATAAAVLLSLTPAAGQAQLLTLPPVPWFVGKSAPPNILLTLDDSGSMAWAYTPDDFDNVVGTAHVAMKSNLNPLYYNPALEYPAPPDSAGLPYPTSFTAARRNGFDASRGTLDLSVRYRPEQQYNPTSTGYWRVDHCRAADTVGGTCPGLNVAPSVETGAYWWTYIPTGNATCPNNPTLPQTASLPVSCFQLGRPTTDEAKQNFANWYSFYRTRNLATVSAAMIGFSKLPSDYRIAWQGLGGACSSASAFPSDCIGWDTSRSVVDARLGPFDAAKRAALWSWLERLPANVGTPLRDALRRAGEYLKTAAAYRDDPLDTASPLSSCRASYSIMMTDGIWNSDSSSVGNADNSTRTLPDGTVYSPRFPFRDNTSDTLADIAFHYWSTDLQPDVANQLRPFTPYKAGDTLTTNEYWDPRNDPANWQRMNSFFVGLGLSNWLTLPGGRWMGSTHAGSASPLDGYNAFAANSVNWPVAQANATPGNVYDLWHAAINGRGQFYSADSPESLIRAFDDMRERIAQREAGVTAAASTSLQMQSDTMMFSTSFSSARWDGTLRAFRLQADGTPDTVPTWTTDNTFNTLSPGSIGSHKVFVRGSSGALVQLQPTDSGLGLLPATVLSSLKTQANALSLGPTSSNAGATTLVRWVLGDTGEPRLRRRDRLLGDLVNSAPVYEGGRDYGYGVTSWTDNPSIDGAVYAAFVKKKRTGATVGGVPEAAKPTVYVGSNDGMLHAFNAKTGAHRFAYMPTPSLSKIGKRADPTAGHDWFVDGQIALHDVHDGTAWRNILIASPGAGARGLFALDVTDPDSPSLLWEWFPADVDLGYVLGEPVIARAASGHWIVAIGNGVGSVGTASGNRASLYVLNALTGAVLKKLDAGSASTTVANGLSGPALLYLSGRQLGFAYAGDLTGKLWRFDLRGAVTDWAVSFSGLPIFQATGPTAAAQPITSKPRIVSDRILGRMILFGTGRLLTPSDPTTTTVQSVYGVRDRSSGGTATRADLTAQTITSESGSSRTLSTNAVATSAAGWYLDLTGTATTSGERVVAPLTYMPEASLALVTTVRPTATVDACATSVTSWTMALSPFSGRAINLFAGTGETFSAGMRQTDRLGTLTPIRMSNNRMKMMTNGGTTGLEQSEVSRTWNPRAAWQQVR
jgi:type IV pilus assembly protein PilY1